MFQYLSISLNINFFNFLFGRINFIIDFSNIFSVFINFSLCPFHEILFFVCDTRSAPVSSDVGDIHREEESIKNIIK